MQVIFTGRSKSDQIGSTVTVAKLYGDDGKLMGRCIDTPNCIATALAHVKGVFLVKNAFGELVSTSKELIKQNKKNPLSFSGYKAK